MRAPFVALLLSTCVLVQAAAGAPSSTSDTPSPASPAQAAPPQSALASPQGPVVSAVDVVDPIFGIHTKVLGLERSVEMLQWSGPDAQGHYQQTWSSQHLVSESADKAHRNTTAFPFNGERWWTTDANIDDEPVSPALLAATDTQAAWSVFAPDMSQLPTNLAVSFQPAGEWLSTSQDAAHPQVGDVRVQWRVIASAPAPSGVERVAGRWELPTTATAPVAATSSVAPSQQQPATTAKDPIRDGMNDDVVWLLAGLVGLVLLVLVLLLLAWRRRSKRRAASRTRRSRKR